MNKLTMVDIARLSGVSLTTVGRVVRKSGYVSDSKREMVEKVIRETGYIPNRIAQGLKSNRTNLIGHLTVLNPNMLYEQVSKSLNRAASGRGYQVLTYAVDLENGDQEKVLDELIAQRVSGIVITSCPRLEEGMLRKVLARGIPLVMIERTLEIPGTDRIVVSDFDGAFDGVQHILGRGHRRIAFVGRKAVHEVESRRLKGYGEALRKEGIAPDPTLLSLRDTYSVEEGVKAALELLELSNPPTAAFMTSDLFVCGFLQECYRRKIRIPEDISLVGYDNTLSMMLSPPISSVSLRLEELGEAAMELLLTRMENGE